AETAVTRNHRRDALRELELHAGMAEERAVVVRVGVDETGREAQALTVDVTRRMSGTADGTNTPVFDLDVGLERRTPATVEHANVTDRQVGHAALPRRCYPIEGRGH